MVEYPAPVSYLQQPLYTDVRNFFGDPDTPRDVLRLRRDGRDMYRFLGTPVLIKRMYTFDDVDQGTAIEAASMDDIYKQPSYEADSLSHGVGYVSKETIDGEWWGTAPDEYVPELVVSPSPPYPYYKPAAKYRGYGPGFLTYAILPDAPEDQWKLTEQGSLVRQQNAMIQLPWWPLVGDNDLVIVCHLDKAGRIDRTYERYQLHQTNPITMHGRDRRGAREFEGVDANNNRYWIGWQAQMTLVPYPDEIYNVEVDR